MNKKILFLIICAYVCLISVFGCKKQKVKHQWREWGAPTVSETVAFGVHPERGSDSNAIPVYVAPIYVPSGRDENGKQVFKKILYEMNKKTPENIDLALKDLGVINQDALFCDVLTKESDGLEFAGPGASSNRATIFTDGIIRYVIDDNHSLESDMVNIEEYLTGFSGNYDNADEVNKFLDEKTNNEKVGLITNEDVIKAITDTYKENYEFVLCNLGVASIEEYNEYQEYKKNLPEYNEEPTTADVLDDFLNSVRGRDVADRSEDEDEN